MPSRLLTLMRKRGGFNPLSLNPTLWALPANSFSRTGGQFTAASSQYLSVASNTSLQISNRVWLSFWVYFDTDPSTSQFLICKGPITSSTLLEYTVFIFGTVFRLALSDGTNVVGLNHTFNPGASQWYHVFGWAEVGGSMGMLIDGANRTSQAGPSNMVTGTGSLGLGYQAGGGVGYHNGRLDNVLFGKPPTSLGDGTPGSLAHTIATTLFNSNNGLPFQSITAQQQSDWGIVSGWLDNSLTADAFGSNTLTNNNGVTQAAGKVNAVAVDNDPVYFVNDASANNNDLTQVTLASRPFYKSAIINGRPVWVLDGTDDYLEKSSVGVIPYPFALYSVFKADTTTSARTLISYGTTVGSNEVVLVIVSGELWALSGGSASKTPFTDTSNYHYASAVFEAEASRTIYLDGIAGTENTTNSPINFTGSHIRVGRRGGTTQYFDGSIAFTCIIPDWTLEKQQSLDTWVQSRFGL